ncbi:MAG: hypothetical protein ABI893_07295 [Polaromonas sp.]|uniref:hypothetical protein n=1 Tax=Polaromonas sp. TaxID=1869339 RepID=UPI00326638E9
MKLKLIAPAFFLVALSGCASYKPVPEGYTGPVATVSDSGFAEDSRKAQLFVIDGVDGNRIANSFGASAGASYGRGFALTTSIVERQVPAKPMKVALRASHTTAAPIHAIASQMAGTFFSVEGVVDFTPQPNGKYVVKGELKKESSSVWIEDAETQLPVTEKVVKK